MSELEIKKQNDTQVEVIKGLSLQKIDEVEAHSILSKEGFTDKQIIKIVKSERLLPHDKLDELASMYRLIQDDEARVLITHKELLKLKSPSLALALSILPTGIFGADRFYIGDTSSGLTKLCTLSCLLFFYFYDMFGISKRTKYNNYLALRKAMGFEQEEFDVDKLNQMQEKKVDVEETKVEEPVVEATTETEEVSKVEDEVKEEESK